MVTIDPLSPETEILTSGEAVASLENEGGAELVAGLDGCHDEFRDLQAQAASLSRRSGLARGPKVERWGSCLIQTIVFCHYVCTKTPA